MPCSSPRFTSFKSVTLASKNPASPRGSLCIFEPPGDLLGVLNAEDLTAFRTAAVSVIIPLSLHRVSRIVVFGTGRQAEWALFLCSRLIERLEHVTLITRASLDRAERLLQGLECEGLALSSGDSPDAVGKAVEMADAIFCCTPATEPLFPKKFLTGDKVRYISLIGSYEPHMKEVDPSVLKEASVKVVVDSAEACLLEAGEIIQAGLGLEDLVEIGQVIRERDGGLGDQFMGNTIFKCVGLAIMDLVVGVELLNIAREREIGVEIPFFASEEAGSQVS